MQSKIDQNNVLSGNGTSAFGSGVYLYSAGRSSDDPWKLDRDVLRDDQAISGDGGCGAFAEGVGGNGGNSEESYGAGIYDGF